MSGMRKDDRMSDTELVQLLQEHKNDMASAHKEMRELIGKLQELLRVVREEFKALHWKLDQLVEIVESLNKGDAEKTREGCRRYRQEAKKQKEGGWIQ
jgi:hypothetical protein